ncbi:hypothetical protein [Brasilonema sp. UFV-L1]|uniref:hypothetical protein n=1 Tax=Brasilonema sp. UFV-L1 TaxID=2234130 RepID=UPI001B7CE5AC|nr:hypothetical protein [Brasilonema sp. UFV-L1]
MSERVASRRLGKAQPRRWQVQIDTVLTRDAVFEGARILARISGCGISAATKLMNNLPGVLLTPLYKFQAQRLVRELNKVQIKAHLISFPQTGGSDGRNP